MTTSSTTDALHRVWESGRFEADKNFVTDRWGTWLSGYLPLRRSDGRFDVVLGIDISAAQVIQERNNMLWQLGQAYLVSLLLTLPLAALVGGQISEPLRSVQKRLQAISRLDFSVENQRRVASAWIYEIHQIVNALDTVQSAMAEFTTYVPTVLVRKLVLNRSSLNLKGEMRSLAIMFTDIRDITSLCDALEPAQMLEFLNQHFAAIYQEAISSQGVLDKYIGDSALLFWGAPDSIEQPALACVEAALNCRDRLDSLNEQWKQQGLPMAFHTVFGIDYGSVVVGNIGPEERVNYTIVGDRVNLAQRLEYSNRLYGSRILASADLVKALGAAAADYVLVKVDDAQLRGFSQPIEVFELLARRSEASQDLLLFTQVVNTVHDLLQQQSYQQALSLLMDLPSPWSQRLYIQQLIRRASEPQDTKAG
jgi:adenylate cyclase